MVSEEYVLAKQAWQAMRSKRKRRQAVTEELVVLVLCAYFAEVMSPAERTHMELVHHAVRVPSVSLPTIGKIVDHFVENHELLVEDVYPRGGGSDTRLALPQGFKKIIVAWV